jgi:microtubule-associated protein-like 1/2
MAYRPNQVASNKNASKHLAVASNDGKVTIREIDWVKVDAGDSAGLNTVIKTLFGKLKKAEWIEFMSYSPDEKFLGVGSHDNTIYLLNVDADYSTYAKLSRHSSFITAFDWSLDSTWIRSVCGAYELLFWNVGAKKQEPSGASNTRGTIWASHSCKLGWHVQGIFPPGCDGSHVNTVCQSTDRKLLATGDDWGLVNIFRNPALDKHECQSYRGHSEHVTQVEFSDDDKYILSTGGQDQTTIQWKLKEKK